MPFGYGEGDPKPCSDRALKLAQAVLGITFASESLEIAKSEARMKDFSGQWNASDYYAEQQEAFYRAAERLELVLDTPYAVYETGDQIELRRSRREPGGPIYRYFGLIREVIAPTFDPKTGEGDKHFCYRVARINDKMKTTDRIVQITNHGITGFADRDAIYQAIQNKEMEPS